MKIGDEIYVRGTVDEIRKDIIIIKNNGGYFGTVIDEIVESPQGNLVEKQTVINAIDDELDRIDHVPQWVYGRLERRVQDLPTVQPEIIRCKDCKQFRRWIDTDICFCDITESEVSDNDFCSRAERREVTG